jgi:hypothetical protein
MKYGESVGEKKRETFPDPHTRNESKDSKRWYPILILKVESRGIHVVKDNGSGWLRWLAGRGHPPKSEMIGCFRTSLS